MVRLSRRVLLLLLVVAALPLPGVAMAQATPTPTVSPTPATPGASHTAGFWIVLLLLVGLLAIYRLRLWRRQ